MSKWRTLPVKYSSDVKFVTLMGGGRGKAPLLDGGPGAGTAPLASRLLSWIFNNFQENYPGMKNPRFKENLPRPWDTKKVCAGEEC